jgi:hypothetical protein
MTMVNCDKASTLTSASLDRRLTLREFVGLWVHRAVCGPCRAYRKQLLLMRRRARRLGGAPVAAAPMDDAAKDRIRARLRATSESPPHD